MAFVKGHGFEDERAERKYCSEDVDDDIFSRVCCQDATIPPIALSRIFLLLWMRHGQILY